MNEYCNNINFSMFPLKHFDFDWTPGRKSSLLDIPLDQVNPDLNNIMNNLGVYISGAYVFYRPEKDHSSIHVDNLGGDYIKINWVFRGIGSKMTWYSVNPKSTIDYSERISKTEAKNSEYIIYKLEDLILEHTAEIVEGTPAILQVGVPHQIDNQLDQRYCFSFVISNIKTHRRLTMKESINVFKEYLFDKN